MVTITRVRVQLDSTWYILPIDSTHVNTWSDTLTAPSITSFNLPGHYYPLTVEVTLSDGTVVTKTIPDTELAELLKLYVKETVSPVTTLVQPANHSIILDPLTPIKFTIVDEQNGSGIDLDTFTLELDGETFDKDSSEISYTVNANGYLFTYTPPTLMDEGLHTIIVNCDDYDGNSADTFEGSFTVDTSVPVFIITYPKYEDDLWINASTLRIEGRAYDEYSNPTTVNIAVDGVDQGEVIVDQDGYFTKIINVHNGINQMVATATDASGYVATINRTFISLNFIFNRTAQDVARIKLLNQRYLLGVITEDELEEWYQDSKGALNRSDLERNEGNMDIMNDIFSVGATASVENIVELPTNEYYAELLSNVQLFRDLPYTTPDTPRVPIQPLNVYTKWNDIEKILYDVVTIWVKNKKARYFADSEIYCGDAIGIL